MPPDVSSTFTNQPILDFSLAIVRDRMRQALGHVRSELGRRYDLKVDGESIQRSETIDSSNPANVQELIGSVPSPTEQDADRAVESANRAFPMWRRTPVDERAALLRRLASQLRARRFELAAWEILECAKPWRDADADVAEAIDFCEYYACEMERLARPRLRHEPGEEDSHEYLPKGVTVVIAPWNFPLAILCGMTVAPLVAGNPVVIKPAEQSTIVAMKFAEILDSLNPPQGVVNCLPGVGETVGRQLVEHPDVAVVSFTGSRAVGIEIAKAASIVRDRQVRLKHVLAEMGGKNAIIVDNDADLDDAVSGVVASAFGYQGQKCSACSRVILLPGVYSAFVERLCEAAASLTLGPPEDPSYSMGPVIDSEARGRLTAVAQRHRMDAKLLLAGEEFKGDETGNYFPPHVFAVDDSRHPLAQEEFFGPILTVLAARNVEDALAIANSTSYALTGGIYSRNPQTIELVKNHFDVGNLYINRKITGAEVDRQPFGGYKMSGTGSKAGGPDYLHHFLWSRTITENTLRRGFAPETS